MTTINTMQDLSRLLREHPEWRDELRRELLTPELLELPQRFAEYTASTDRRLDTLTERLDALAERVGELTERLDTLTERLDALTEQVSELTERLDTLTERLDALTEQVSELTRHAEDTDRRIDRIEQNINRMSNDFRNFRWNYAESAAVKEFINIAIDLNDFKSLDLEETAARVVTQNELLAMASSYGNEKLAEIPKNDRRSFYRSDLVIETQRQDGETCYIAVEASYTCDDRDTDRALTHADLITRFTQKTAWPVIAGVRVDNRIQPEIDEGKVFWYPLDEESLHP